MLMVQVYPLTKEQILERFTIEMPEGSEILNLQKQGDTPLIWAHVETDEYSHYKMTF